MLEDQIIDVEEFTNECNRLLDEYDNLPEGTDVTAWLASQTDSEEEKSVVEEFCQETITFQQKMKEWIMSKLPIAKWFEREVENTAKELFPDITSAEMNEFKAEIDKAMDGKIEITADTLAEETEDVVEELQKGGNV